MLSNCVLLAADSHAHNLGGRASSFAVMTFCTQQKKALSNWTINSNV